MAAEEIKYRNNEEHNRAYDKRRDNDTIKTPSISIYDVDYAILYWLREKIAFQVPENGNMIDVPIVYANGETWSQIQAHGYLRDSQNQLLTPYGTLRRVTMTEDERFKKLDINRGSYGSSYKIIPNPDYRNFENQRNPHAQTTNTRISNQYFIQVMPEYYIVEYELLFWTTLVEQMNTILQDLIPTSNFAWGDSYKFRSSVGSISHETVNAPDSQRLVRATIPITVDARLINEFELKKSTVEKAFTLKRLVIRNERSSFDAIPLDYNQPFPNHNKNKR